LLTATSTSKTVVSQTELYAETELVCLTGRKPRARKTKHKALGIDQNITHRASHHLAFCCPIGRMIVNVMKWHHSIGPLQSRNSTKNITTELVTKNITADLRKIVMEAKEGEKKRGTKGKIEQMKIMLLTSRYILIYTKQMAKDYQYLAKIKGTWHGRIQVDYEVKTGIIKVQHLHDDIRLDLLKPQHMGSSVYVRYGLDRE
ncbi:hypothetical protein ACJX0J_024827, partial [Zea mays]